MQPIFIGITRSFWLAVVAVGTFLGFGEPVFHALATLIVTVAGDALPWSADAITAWLVDVAPIGAVLLILHQRRGANRPYTIRPNSVTMR